MEKVNNKIFNMSFIILGLFLGVLSLFLPTKIWLLIIVAFVGLIFTFYCLEISLGCFIVLIAIVPHGLWNNIFILLASVFYFGVYLIQTISGKRKKLNFKDINIFLIFFVIFGFYSVLISRELKDSLRMFVILASCILFSITITGIINNKKTLDTLMSFICIAVFLSCVYGILQKFLGIEIKSEFIDATASSGMPGRLYSTMDNANNFAEFLVLTIPICLSHFLNTKNEVKKLIILGISMFGILVLVLTLSRGAYIVFAVGFAIYILLINKRLIPFGIILVALLTPLIPDMIINRLMTVGKDSSSSYRLMIWENVFLMLKDYWITGIGMGPKVFENIYGLYFINEAYKAMHSHNLMLQILVEMGIGGFISFILFLISFIKKTFVSFLNTKNKYYKNLLAAFIYSIISVVAYGFAEYIWYYPRVMLMFWMVIGFSFGTIKIAKEEN